MRKHEQSVLLLFLHTANAGDPTDADAFVGCALLIYIRSPERPVRCHAKHERSALLLFLHTVNAGDPTDANIQQYKMVENAFFEVEKYYNKNT